MHALFVWPCYVLLAACLCWSRFHACLYRCLFFFFFLEDKNLRTYSSLSSTNCTSEALVATVGLALYHAASKQVRNIGCSFAVLFFFFFLNPFFIIRKTPNLPFSFGPCVLDSRSSFVCNKSEFHLRNVSCHVSKMKAAAGHARLHKPRHASGSYERHWLPSQYTPRTPRTPAVGTPR